MEMLAQGLLRSLINGEGIAGIVPNCKILPIRIPFGAVTQTLLSKYAAAIRLAANNADVISNSWSIGTNNQNYSAEIVDAIRYATSSGRRGSKGSVVVFAAGNTANRVAGNNGYIQFPANVNISGVLTVGAVDRNGQQANYSPTSDRSSSQNQIIDVVAPSHKAYSSQISSETFDVWSIDIPSTAGYNYVHETDGGSLPVIGSYLPNSGTNYQAYTGHFGGTSAAAPQVAGIAALMLSINPNLTAEQVSDIIRNTAKYGKDNVGSNGGWTSAVGYGLVNAEQAVTSALLYNCRIMGPSFDLRPDKPLIYRIPDGPLPTGVTFNGWTVDNGTNYTTTNGLNSRVLTITFKSPGDYQLSANFTLPNGVSYSPCVDIYIPSPSQNLTIPVIAMNNHNPGAIEGSATIYVTNPDYMASAYEWRVHENGQTRILSTGSTEFTCQYKKNIRHVAIQCRAVTPSTYSNWGSNVIVIGLVGM